MDTPENSEGPGDARQSDRVRRLCPAGYWLEYQEERNGSCQR